MARDKEQPCINYICFGECKIGREANHFGYCQKCNKYYPRAKTRVKNKKREFKYKLKDDYDK